MKNNINNIIGLINILANLNEQFSVYINAIEIANPISLWTDDNTVYIIKNNKNLITIDISDIKIISLLRY